MAIRRSEEEEQKVRSERAAGQITLDHIRHQGNRDFYPECFKELFKDFKHS